MITLHEVLREIYDQPSENWPPKFRGWLEQVTQDIYVHHSGYRDASTYDDYREYTGLALEQFGEWLEQEGLNT